MKWIEVDVERLVNVTGLQSICTQFSNEGGPYFLGIYAGGKNIINYMLEYSTPKNRAESYDKIINFLEDPYTKVLRYVDLRCTFCRTEVNGCKIDLRSGHLHYIPPEKPTPSQEHIEQCGT